MRHTAGQKIFEEGSLVRVTGQVRSFQVRELVYLFYFRTKEITATNSETRNSIEQGNNHFKCFLSIFFHPMIILQHFHFPI